VFSFPRYLVKSAQGQKDKFEALCRVNADISSASYISKPLEAGEMGYRRDHDITLLVGLTELKAQVSWIDSKTVRPHHALHAPIYFYMCESRGKREGL
jgi:hypothetical protein